MHDPRLLSVHFHIHRSRPCWASLRRPPGGLPGPPLPAPALPAGPVASTGSGPEAGVVTRDGDLADCAVGEGTDGGDRRSWRKRGEPGGRGRQRRRDPWAALPTEIRRGQDAGVSGRLVLAGGPPPPSCPVSQAGPSPLVRSDHTLEGFAISRFPLVARAGSQPGRSVPGVSPTLRGGAGQDWGLPCGLKSLWAGFRSGGRLFSEPHRLCGGPVCRMDQQGLVLNPGQETFPASASDTGLGLGGECPVPSAALGCLSMLQALSFRCSCIAPQQPHPNNLLGPPQHTEPLKLPRPLALPLCSVLAATHALSPLSTQAQWAADSRPSLPQPNAGPQPSPPLQLCFFLQLP